MVMMLPSSSGTQYSSTVGWSIIILQAVSIANQIWYNVKPLLVILAGSLYTSIFGEEEEEEEEVDSEEELEEDGSAEDNEDD